MLRDLSPAMRITRGIRECHVALALFLLLAGGVRARAEGLPELLQAVATNARFASPARADVRIECGESCNATGTPAIFLGRGEVLYVEVRGGQRVLIRPGEILVAQGGKASAAVPGQTLADTDVLLEDLAVFTPGALKQPQISDDGPAGVVGTAAPAGRSSYALLVNTIVRQRAPGIASATVLPSGVSRSPPATMTSVGTERCARSARRLPDQLRIPAAVRTSVLAGTRAAVAARPRTVRSRRPSSARYSAENIQGSTRRATASGLASLATRHQASITASRRGPASTNGVISVSDRTSAGRASASSNATAAPRLAPITCAGVSRSAATSAAAVPTS